MNIMLLKRFRNELIIIATLIFALTALSYKFSIQSSIQDKQQKLEKEIQAIEEVLELKKLWGNPKAVSKEADKFKTIVEEKKIKSFEKRSKKMVASYENLSVKELNSITRQLFKTPLQIIKLDIKESGKERYTMEFTCKW